MDLFATPRTLAERRADGSIVLESALPPGPHAASMAHLFREAAAAHPGRTLEQVGRLGPHVIRRIAAHHEAAAGDLEHRHVVDPVADGDGLGERAARAVAQRAQGGAFVHAGGACEDRVLAGIGPHRELHDEQLAAVREQLAVRRDDRRLCRPPNR